MGEATLTDWRQLADATFVRDDAAFEALFDAHHAGAYRLAMLLAGGEAALAEDAVSEAFVQVLPRWRAGSVDDFGPYLRRVVVNQVKRAFRTRALVRRHQPLFEVGSITTEDQVVRKQIVWAALQALPPKQRAAVVLHYYEALPLDEVAAAMGTSLGTAKSNLARGREHLRPLLEELR